MTDLASVIKQIESAGNPHALRFEPDAYQNWAWVSSMDRIKAKHSCTIHTAKVIACSSWGLYQLMGVNIFDPVFFGAPYQIDPADIFEFVNDTDMQDSLFKAFLQHKNIDFSLNDLMSDAVKMQRFVVAYNGPGNVDAYSALIRQHAGA